jgi:carboxylesterase type B
MSSMDDPLNFAQTLGQRKESARRTLRQASTEELRALVLKLFADTVHPFAEPMSQFIEEHRSETAVRGETSDGVSFVYYPRTNRGMWYMYTGQRLSVGVLGKTSLKALSDLTTEAGFF